MHPIFEEVRKQLRATPNARGKWAPEQWWEAFVYLFYYGPKHGLQPEADDLLLLVIEASQRGTSKEPYFAIRREEELPAEFHVSGWRFSQVDWHRSLELNLVMQTAYTVTVAVCSEEEVASVGQEGALKAEGSLKVVKRVHASTVTVGLGIDTVKATEAVVCYPHICFAVEDHEEAFNSLVLTEEDQRFCVILSTVTSLQSSTSVNDIIAQARTNTSETPTGTPASPVAKPLGQEEMKDDAIRDPLMNPAASSPMKADVHRSSYERDSDTFPSCSSPKASGIRIFGGLVMFDQLKRRLLGTSLCLPRKVLQECVIQMKGPGGEGLAEVCTSIDAEPSTQSTSEGATSEPDVTWERRGMLFFRSSVRSARDLFQRITTDKRPFVDVTEDTRLGFRCSLMTLTLPVTVVALKILEC